MPTSRYCQAASDFAARSCSASWILPACLTALTGCVGGSPPPLIDTSMPVIIDYREHLVLNPPPVRAKGRVDQPLTGSGRERRFGPDAQLLKVDRTNLASVLDVFRSQEPHGAAAFVGLAKKKPAAKVRQEAADPPVEDDDRTGSIEEHPVDAPVPDTVSGREARLNPDAIKNSDGGYKLNFEDADIKDVLQAVLGDVLHVSYTLAPNIMGKLTIFSAAPQDRVELFATIESVLAMQGLSMIPTANGYRIAPAAPGAGSIDRDGKAPGFGISVVPLQYSSSSSVLKLVSGFLSDAEGVRIDTARNTIIVRAPAPRRAEIVRAIKGLDTDWMHSQSVSIVELRRSNPDEIVGELTHIFDTDRDAGGATGSIEFKALKRLRSIMVISRNPQLVRRATAWIRRLDHLAVSATPGIYVYRPQYREARELVRLIKGLFGGASGGGSAAGDVAFQNGGPSTPGPGQGQSLNGSIGQSSASFAGGLSSSAFGSGGGSSNGQGGGGGFGNATGAFGVASVGTSGSGAPAAGGGVGGPGAPGGLSGSAAEPIEAGRGEGGGDKTKLSLTADTGNNSIVAYTDGETYAKVSAVLRQLDLPPLQVAINVTVAEVDLNDALKYGVQFYLNNMPGQVSLQATAQQGLAIASSVVAAGTSAGAYGGIGSFGSLGNISAGTQDIVLTALNAVSKVHVLSNPSIVVMENKPATFEVGNQVPVTTQSATSTIGTNSPTLNQVQYLDTGIILKIIPRVGQKGEVDMDLDQIISSVVPQANGAQSLTPTISKRRVASNISVRSGQSVMLAGLIQDQRQRARAQLPFVGGEISDVLGNSDNAFSRTELVIFIHPTIIRSGGDAAAFVEGYRQKLRTVDLHAPMVPK